jgi:predicted nucleic acid-binding protein
MAAWLLGPEAFADFVSGRGDGTVNPVLDWADTLTDAQICVSEMTWAYVRSQALEITVPRLREGWIRALDEQVPAEFGSRLLPIQRLHLARWSEVRLELGPSGKRLSSFESFDAAVCIVEQLGYVTRSAHLSAIPTHPTQSPW